MCLVLNQGAIGVVHVLVHPFARDDVGVGRWDKVPCLVGYERIEILDHVSIPKQISERTMVFFNIGEGGSMIEAL
jgi:hypothetical protein